MSDGAWYAHPVVTAAVISATVTLFLPVVKDWLRHRNGRSDAEIAARLRDELYRRLQTLQEAYDAVVAQLTAAERRVQEQELENLRLRRLNEEQSAQIAALTARVHALETTVRVLREGQEG